MDGQNKYQEAASSIKDRWEGIQRNRVEFANQIAGLADDLAGERSKQLRSISRWIRRPHELEDALQRPDVLAICMPLIKSPDDQQQMLPLELKLAARYGYCWVVRYTLINRRLARRFAYPILILAVALLMGILFSFWVAPQFEEMFSEFGIQLPEPTRLVLWAARFVRSWWWMIFVVPVLVAVANWIWTIGSNRSAGPGWINRRLMGTRLNLASWSWHVSLLLDAGMSESDACRYAGSVTGIRELRDVPERLDNRQMGHSNGKIMANSNFELLKQSIQMPLSEGKIAMLREVSAYYWNRNRNIGDWWIQWLGVVILWMVGACIFVAILALFMPLFAVVSGLSGVN